MRLTPHRNVGIRGENLDRLDLIIWRFICIEDKKSITRDRGTR